MTYFRDIAAILKADGIALDETEAALLGAPKGDTLSLWAATQARHGSFLASVACALLSVLVQWDHCHKQMIGAPMKPMNYTRAFVLLLVGPLCLGFIIWWLL